MLVKEMAIDERPREKADKYGIASLSNRELLAIILRTGYQGKSSLLLADEILSKCSGLSGLQGVNVSDLTSIKGIKKAKALQILSCIELSRRFSFEEVLNKDVIDNPDLLVKWLKKEIGIYKQELFLAVYLDTKNAVIGHKILFKGTIDKSMIFPREIFKEALLLSSKNVLLVHNHPSGDTTPSNADITSTKKMMQAGELMGVRVIDHIIVSMTSHCSLAKRGLI